MQASFLAVSTAALSFVAASAAYATPSKPGSKPPAPVAIAKSAPDFGAMLQVFDKMFPPQPDPDPARLALARSAAQPMWPDGAYGKVMTDFMGGMFNRVMQMKPSDFAGVGPMPAKKEDSTAPANVSIHDAAAAKDPFFDKRVAAIRVALGEELTKISAVIDPRVREGLARSMARRFDARQLTEINTFFATPSGRAFANQYLQLWVDPDALRSMMGSVPELMKLMPELMQKVKAADEKFPHPAKTPTKAAKL